MYRASKSSGRRSTSTRPARVTSKRRRGDSRRGGAGGLKQRFEEAAERPAKKWVKIWRSPGAKISFKVAKWVLLDQLTEDERRDYEARQPKPTPPTTGDISAENRGDTTVTTNLPGEGGMTTSMAPPTATSSVPALPQQGGSQASTSSVAPPAAPASDPAGSMSAQTDAATAAKRPLEAVSGVDVDDNSKRPKPDVPPETSATPFQG